MWRLQQSTVWPVDHLLCHVHWSMQNFMNVFVRAHSCKTDMMDHVLWRSNLANKAFTSNTAYEKDAGKHQITKTDAFWHDITLVIPDDACKLAIGQRYASQRTQTGLTSSNKNFIEANDHTRAMLVPHKHCLHSITAMCVSSKARTSWHEIHRLTALMADEKRQSSGHGVVGQQTQQPCYIN